MRGYHIYKVMGAAVGEEAAGDECVEPCSMRGYHICKANGEDTTYARLMAATAGEELVCDSESKKRQRQVRCSRDNEPPTSYMNLPP